MSKKSTRPKPKQQEIFTALGVKNLAWQNGKNDNMKQNKKSSAITTPAMTVTHCYCIIMSSPLTKLG
jgi:hypothetical protein